MEDIDAKQYTVHMQLNLLVCRMQSKVEVLDSFFLSNYQDTYRAAQKLH